MSEVWNGSLETAETELEITAEWLSEYAGSGEANVLPTPDVTAAHELRREAEGHYNQAFWQ